MPAAIKHTKTTSSRSALLILIVANFSSRSSRYILMDHHPPHRLARAFETVRSTPLDGRHQTGAQQRQTRPGIAPAQAVIAPRQLVKMTHVKSRISISVQLRELLDFCIRRPLPRHLPNPAIPQSSKPVLVIPAAQPQKMTWAATQDHRRIRTTQSPSLNLTVKLLKALHPYRLRQCPIAPYLMTPFARRSSRHQNRTYDASTHRTYLVRTTQDLAQRLLRGTLYGTSGTNRRYRRIRVNAHYLP